MTTVRDILNITNPYDVIRICYYDGDANFRTRVDDYVSLLDGTLDDFYKDAKVLLMEVNSGLVCISAELD